jgi:Asp-tRNA(Asn)/Glu-tRNA(Gln) amidotransferase A subunit family amidase
VDELHYLSATEALDLFRARELSPVELMEAVIARAEHVEPSVNALGVRFFDEALAAAEQAEQRYARTHRQEPRPLEGLPIAIKEEMPVKGQRTTQGSLVYADSLSDHSAVVAHRVIDAGAIIHARSNAPEFSCAGFTHSRLWGVTRNPWNLDYSPGGSSGGSAASLAAGTTTLATGSDLGGSIRIPAACCGVVGFKPTYGRVPVEPPYNLDHWCHEGPMTRTVSDCALLFDVLSGPDASDVTTLRPKLEVGSVLGGVEGWKVALCVTLGDYEVDEDVQANTRAAAEVFRDAGAVVEEVDLRWSRREIVDAALIHFGIVFGAEVQREVDDHPDLLTTYAIWFAENASRITKEDYFRGLEIESRIYAALSPVLEEFDVLICPTAAAPALESGQEYLDAGPRVNGVQLDHVYDILMTLPFNICSRCPAISVPSGFAANGVPTGVQIVGRTFDDANVLRAAAAYERLRPWPGSGQSRPNL